MAMVLTAHDDKSVDGNDKSVDGDDKSDGDRNAEQEDGQAFITQKWSPQTVKPAR